MKIICSGLSKTGTKTMAVALTMLGYNVHDFKEQYFYNGDELCRMMTEGWTEEDLKRVFGNVDAVTDLPANYMWEELLEGFPDAKVIHMERFSEKYWAESLEKQLMSIDEKRFWRFLVALKLSPSGYKLGRFLNTAFHMVFSRPPSTPFRDGKLNKSLAMIRYRQHNTRVRAVVPEDKLLIYKFSDGWQPLCNFLGKPVPNQTFPHKNKNASMTDECVDQSFIFKPVKAEIRKRLSLVFVLFSLLLSYFIFF